MPVDWLSDSREDRLTFLFHETKWKMKRRKLDVFLRGTILLYVKRQNKECR